MTSSFGSLQRLRRRTGCRLATLAISGLVSTLVSSPVASQVVAWTAQHDSGHSDPVSYHELFAHLSGPSQPVAFGPDGAHYAAITVERPLSFDAALVRHDAAGELSWVRWLPGHSWFAGAVGVDDDDDVYVAHYDQCSYLRKLDAAGNVLWTTGLAARRLAASSCDTSRCGMEQSTFWDLKSRKYSVARVDSDGTIAWSYIHSIPDTGQIFGRALALDSQGAVIAAASFFETYYSTADWLVLKLDPSGNLSWEKAFDYGGIDIPISIAVGPDDRVTVAGLSNSIDDQGLDYLTIQYDASGSELWSDRIVRQNFFFNGFTPETPLVHSDSTGTSSSPAF